MHIQPYTGSTDETCTHLFTGVYLAMWGAQIKSETNGDKRAEGTCRFDAGCRVTDTSMLTFFVLSYRWSRPS